MTTEGTHSRHPDQTCREAGCTTPRPPRPINDSPTICERFQVHPTSPYCADCAANREDHDA